MKILNDRKSIMIFSFAFMMALPSFSAADQKNFREAADACMKAHKPPVLTPGTAPSLEAPRAMEECLKNAGFEAPPLQDMGQMKELKAPERAPSSADDQGEGGTSGQQ